MTRTTSRIVIGAGAACGILCVLPLALTALGISGATAVAAVVYPIDELVFCSPIGVRIALAGSVLVIAAYAFRGIRRVALRRSQRAKSCQRP